MYPCIVVLAAVNALEFDELDSRRGKSIELGQLLDRLLWIATIKNFSQFGQARE